MSIPSSLIIPLVGLVYLLGFGALSVLRQQGLSFRFAVEGLLIIGAGTLCVLLSVPLHPLLFVLVLYVVTMRVRLLVDLGNWQIARRQPQRALQIFQIALRLGPDAVGRQIVLINRGVAQLRLQDPEAAFQTLEEAMGQETVRVGARYLSAGYYNLGLACRRTGREAQAVRHLNQAIDVCPGSIYARAAQRALKERTADST